MYNKTSMVASIGVSDDFSYAVGYPIINQYNNEQFWLLNSECCKHWKQKADESHKSQKI